MQSTTKFVGLDVSKEKIAVAIADSNGESPRYYGSIPHSAAALRKLIKELGPAYTLSFCYEAGPTGYETYRWITSMGAQCAVIAPSLIPKRPGDQVKTDRRDAEQLARLFRAGELTPVYVPEREDEALRELVRAREAAADFEVPTSAPDRTTRYHKAALDEEIPCLVRAAYVPLRAYADCL